LLAKYPTTGTKMTNLIDIYNTLQTILKTVTDPNTTRLNKSGRWIYPGVPTAIDKFYPRVTIQFLNIEEEAISASGFLNDNFDEEGAEVVKTLTTGYVYNVTMWIGLFVKTETLLKMLIPGDTDKSKVKNTLLANLLFEEMVKAIDANTAALDAIAYDYKPNERTFELGYQDDSKRVVNSMTLNIKILSTTAIVFDEANILRTIEENNGDADLA
jgi:hypothetical protein